MFTGREREMAALDKLYAQNSFQLFILYGRRRVGKTTLLTEFCRNKPAIFFSAEETNAKFNLAKLSELIFQYYGENNLSPFNSWEQALGYIKEHQQGKQLLLVLDEFPYLAANNRGLLSSLQHLIDHSLQDSKLFIVLCGSYLGFMEKEVLSAKSPLFGRRTAQLKLEPLDYYSSLPFLAGFAPEEQLLLYGSLGGTPLYLSKIDGRQSLAANIRSLFLEPTGYFYSEPAMLLRQEVQEPAVYNAIISAIANGATRASEIAGKTGEESAKCLKYINILRELGLIYRETPLGEKASSRRNIYRLKDQLFCFWYRYVAGNLTLLETGAASLVWQRRILPDYPVFMGLAFEKICQEYLLRQNAAGKLPLLATEIGRWWGSNPSSAAHEQVEIDLIARDGQDVLLAECKWRNEALDIPVLRQLQEKADIFQKHRSHSWYYLFSKSGFTQRLQELALTDPAIKLVGLPELLSLS